MSRRSQREFLEGQINLIEDLLRTLPDDAVLERLGFEDRLEQLRSSIAADIDTAGNFARARLVFGGAPVASSDGIEARFAADVLGAYQDLVSKTLAAPVTLNASGPVPFERQSRLHITDIVRGSFGFELDEVQEQDSFAQTPLREAVEQAAMLIRAAASSDDDFVDTLVDVKPRVQESLRRFFETLAKANATIGLETWDVKVDFDSPTIALASERVSIAFREELELLVPGVFQGVLHVSRSFEHQPLEGDLVKGKADPGVNLAGLDPWTLKRCAVRLKRVSWQRAGKQYLRYTLLGIEPDDGSARGSADPKTQSSE